MLLYVPGDMETETCVDLQCFPAKREADDSRWTMEADKVRFVSWMWEVRLNLCDSEPQVVNLKIDVPYCSEGNVAGANEVCEWGAG